MQNVLRLGNLDAKRDWGYAKDYMEAVWTILQYATPDDFVIATGEAHSVREFVEEVGKHLGMDIVWKGKGLKEKGVDRKTGKTLIEIDPYYFRPNEVEFLQGDATKAKKLLGWKPRTTFAGLAELMAREDLAYIQKESSLGRRDFSSRKFIVDS